jgi:hypothetical protein
MRRGFDRLAQTARERGEHDPTQAARCFLRESTWHPRGQSWGSGGRSTAHRVDAETFARAVSQAGPWPFERTIRRRVQSHGHVNA